MSQIERLRLRLLEEKQPSNIGRPERLAAHLAAITPTFGKNYSSLREPLAADTSRKEIAESRSTNSPEVTYNHHEAEAFATQGVNTVFEYHGNPKL